MMPRSYDEKDEAFIRNNCEEMTVPQLSECLSIPRGVIYQLLRKMGRTAKSAKIERTIQGVILNPNRLRALTPDPPKKPLIRPAAEYSNGGFQEVKRKYL